MSTINTSHPNRHEKQQPHVEPYPLTGGYRWELSDHAATVQEADKRTQSLRVRQWTPRPAPRGGGYGSSAMEALCREFGRLAVEMEEGWA